MRIDLQLWATTVSPKEISLRTGIRPDVELMRGERNPQIMLPRENLWAVKSKSNSDLVADHWADLETIVRGKSEALREVALTGKAKLTIVVDAESRMPSINIPPAMSAFAAFLNAEIDLDHLQK